MYAEFYGLVSEPFHVTPDPSRLFMTEKHKDAVGAVLYGIMAGKGFVAITGDVGVGKTTVLRYCLDRLAVADGPAAKMEIVYVLQPALTPLELFRVLHREMIGGGDAERDALSSAQLVQAIQRHLLDAYDHGRAVVVVVDEAQNMPVETLESFRTLSNLETNSSKLLQIVLVGQTELDALLARHELRQLDQRIAARAYIPPMTRREARQYIAHRLSVASHGAAKPFTRGAINFILTEARGNARRINMMCDNALMNGFGHRARRVTRAIARQAIRQLDNRARARPPRHIFRPSLAWASAFVAALILLSGAGLGLTTLPAAIGGAPSLLKRIVGLVVGDATDRSLPSAPLTESVVAIPTPSPMANPTSAPAAAPAPPSAAATTAAKVQPPMPNPAPVTQHAMAEPPTPPHAAAEKPRAKPVVHAPLRIAAPAGPATAAPPTPDPCHPTHPLASGSIVEGAVSSPCSAPATTQAVPAQVVTAPGRPLLDPIGRPIRPSTVDVPEDRDLAGQPTASVEVPR
ncbi:MAG TPA: AAA family ATPase [Candidatus Sulfotelmatobacter sp.]|nr:AAA family ATPase [Candidatus Sulfotelmatobacter sp.]